MNDEREFLSALLIWSTVKRVTVGGGTRGRRPSNPASRCYRGCYLQPRLML